MGEGACEKIKGDLGSYIFMIERLPYPFRVQVRVVLADLGRIEPITAFFSFSFFLYGTIIN